MSNFTNQAQEEKLKFSDTVTPLSQ